MNTDNLTKRKKAIGQRINTLLADRKIEQRELAKRFKVKPNIISYWCSGERTPNHEQIFELAKMFGVSIDYIYGKTTVQSPDADTIAICEYTGLSEKALEKLHAFNTVAHDVYTLEYGDPFLLDKIFSQLFEDDIIQDIVIQGAELLYNSTALIDGQDIFEPSHFFYYTDLLCDVKKLAISDALLKIANLCDERAKQKERYQEYKDKYESTHKKHYTRFLNLNYGQLKDTQQKIYEKYLKLSQANKNQSSDDDVLSQDDTPF